MNEEAIKEIRSSKLLKFYNILVKIYEKNRLWYMITILTAFVVAFIDTAILNRENSSISIGVILTAWTPGILFLLISAPTHFLTGIKLRRMASKYKIEYKELLLLAFEETK